MPPDGVVSRLSLVGETHVDQDGDWEDADQTGDHQVATDRLPTVRRDIRDLCFIIYHLYKWSMAGRFGHWTI